MFVLQYKDYHRCGFIERYHEFATFSGAVHWIQLEIEKMDFADVTVKWYNLLQRHSTLLEPPRDPGSYSCAVYLDGDIGTPDYTYRIIETNCQYTFYKDKLESYKLL